MRGDSRFGPSWCYFQDGTDLWPPVCATFKTARACGGYQADGVHCDVELLRSRCLQNGMPVGVPFRTARYVAGTRIHLCPREVDRVQKWDTRDHSNETCYGCVVARDWNASWCYVLRNVVCTRCTENVHVDAVWEIRSSVSTGPHALVSLNGCWATNSMLDNVCASDIQNTAGMCVKESRRMGERAQSVHRCAVST